jgi:hypothetical protein
LPTLQIPDRHQPGIARIRELGEPAISAIRNILDQAPDTINPIEIAATDAAKMIDNIPGLKGILDALASMYVLKSSKESVSLEQFTEDVTDAMASLKSESAITSDRSKFKASLSTLLGSEHFLTISKGFELATDDERTFCDARVITDLRPVFGTPIEDGPRGTVIVHLLKIGYHEGQKRHQSFHVALDSRDLKELNRVIERA